MAITDLQEPYLPQLSIDQVSVTEGGRGSNVDESVRLDVAQLVAAGYDVSFVDPYDEHAPDAATQEDLDAMADYLEAVPNGDELFIEPPAMQKWVPLTKRAIALHPLYRASVAKTLGDGIDEAAYDRPLFPSSDVEGRIVMKSAKEILFQERPEKAPKILGSYLDFIGTPIDEVSRAFYMGSKDAEGVRTRAIAAMDIAKEHILKDPSISGRNDLVSASLACGAAGPVYDLVKELRQQGNDFSRAILVDKDEMALASAAALAEEANVDEIVDIQRRDLLGEPLTDYIEPNSVDIVDLLGLFEYLPSDFGVMLLEKVKEIVRPGGLIIFGNMLDKRPQQRLFTDVAKWPPLEQRSVSEVLSIIEKAGLDLSQTVVRIPAREGVYAVYGIKVASEEN